MLMTGNDFALARMAVSLAISWHRATPSCDFREDEIAKLSALSVKLDELLDDHAAIISSTDGECDFEVRDDQDMTPRG